MRHHHRQQGSLGLHFLVIQDFILA